MRDAGRGGEFVTLWCNMGWDKKRRGDKGGYYYQSVRVGGRAVKKYVGTGPFAELTAHLDQKKRAARAAAKADERADRSRLEAADRAIIEARRLAGLLAAAVLVLHGYHEHHGCWRKRTESKP